MRLARRALVAALATLMLCVAASAQSLRAENDPRNIAPTVGTGGPVGGPTGLFTVYDGETLRRGEFTFSFSYSVFHRDPGSVHFEQVPVSFQLGLNDHIEVFFDTDAYTGIKVKQPQNLSSFYLPNSQLFINGGLTVPPAIVLAPNNPRGVGGALFRPAGDQTFTPFPFVGSPSGNFGLVPGQFTPVSFNGTLGAGGNPGSNFGAASNFPGIGSVYGSILPGVVLATTMTGPTATTLPITTPLTFTLAPSYLPDAPFISRLWGESSFNTFVAGAKILLSKVNRPYGFGVIPFYRFYNKRANDAIGFNRLQRGGGTGANLGDFGVILFASARLSKKVNVSGNIGYIYNSNPKSTAFGGGSFTLLNRPKEVISGVAVDLPLNKHIQPIFEISSDLYVGGRTPNAFENSPLDGLAGVRIFPRRWYGVSGAYRIHINDQRNGKFNGTLPVGFVRSDDPSGYIFQFFAGHRNARLPEVLPNQPPVISSFTASSSTVTLPANCTPPQVPDPSCTPSSATTVTLTTTASDPDGDTLLYTYSSTGGRITGNGPNATLDLTGVQAGTYTATVEVDDGCGCVAFTSTSITVANCGCITPPPPCPTVNVSCPDTAPLGQPITFTANVSGGAPNVTPTFSWSVSVGTISSGQGTNTITVTDVPGGQQVTATVTVGGYDPSCRVTATCTTTVQPPNNPQKFDEYGNIRFNDEKARLDNFAVQLQNAPATTQGYIIAYGGRRGRPGEAQARADRAKNYLVNNRGIDPGRIVTVDGGLREDLTVELWLVPQGATPPAATPTPGITPEPRAPRRRARHRRGEEEE